MRNKILSITRSSIPYVKELRELTGSVTATILMQQLDYWFDKTDGKPFYKFLESCVHKDYKKGDSWCEELGFSPDEFRNAFHKIGTAYKSIEEYEKAKSNGILFNRYSGADGGAPVGVSFYCYVIDKVNHITHYHRNHEYVDQALNRLLFGDESENSDGSGGWHIGKGNVSTLANPISYIGTETTKTETTNKKKEEEKKIPVVPLGYCFDMPKLQKRTEDKTLDLGGQAVLVRTWDNLMKMTYEELQEIVKNDNSPEEFMYKNTLLIAMNIVYSRERDAESVYNYPENPADAWPDDIE